MQTAFEPNLSYDYSAQDLESWGTLYILDIGNPIGYHYCNWKPLLNGYIRIIPGNSLVVQWLGLCVFTAECAGSIPGWGTKIPQAMQHGQKKKKEESQCYHQPSQGSSPTHPEWRPKVCTPTHVLDFLSARPGAVRTSCTPCSRPLTPTPAASRLPSQQITEPVKANRNLGDHLRSHKAVQLVERALWSPRG